MKPPPPDPHFRHRVPAEIISHAGWFFLVFSLSMRDVELLLAERGVIVSYETVRALVRQEIRPELCQPPAPPPARTRR